MIIVELKMSIAEKIEEALERIPYFDGNPNDLDNFLDGLQNAQDSVPGLLENFPEIVILKLLGEALDETWHLSFNHLDELKMHLAGNFG